MPTTLKKGRRLTVLLAVVAVLTSLVAFAAPAGALDSAACPKDSIPSAGFTDLAGVPTDAVDAINCIAFYGISIGTSATTFSPFADVERWQMALFLARAAVDMDITLSSGASGPFTDLAGVPASAVTAINQIYDVGITTGTSATTFDPFGDVERWQMALFLIRLLDEAGVTLPSGADQGFTDLAGVPTAAVTAINQVKQLGVSTGTSATTFDPFGIVERWQMALFLARALQSAGVVPTGLGFFITGTNVGANQYTYANPSTCETVTVTYKSTDSFQVNGAAATEGAFETALGTTGNKRITQSGTTHILTTGVKVDSGVAATVAGEDFTIEEPVSGNTLATYDVGSTPFEFYVVGGTATTLAGWTENLSVGDTVSVSGGDGTTAAKARTYTLTNAAASGTVSDAGAIDIDTGCQVLTVGTPVATDTFVVDGAASNITEFNAEISVGDSLSYTKVDNKVTWTLTNMAPAALSGEAIANNIDDGDTDPRLELFDVALSATKVVTVNIEDAGGTPDFGGTWDIIRVNGANATIDDFLGALTPGDTVTIREADAVTGTQSQLTLSDGPYAGAPAVITTAAETLSVYAHGTTGAELDTVSYTATSVAGLSTGTGGSVLYTVNGSSANQGQFEAAVGLAIANEGGNVTLSKVGNDLVWAVTTS